MSGVASALLVDCYVPYATAMRRGQMQDGMRTKLCNHIDRIEDLG